MTFFSVVSDLKSTKLLEKVRMASGEIDPELHRYQSIIIEGVKAKSHEATLLFIDFSEAFGFIHSRKMKQMLSAYGIPQKTVRAIMILYKNLKAMVHSPSGDTVFFDIVTGVFQGDAWAPYLIVLCLDYELRTLIDLIKENGFTLKNKTKTDHILQKQWQMQTTQMIQRFLKIHKL